MRDIIDEAVASVKVRDIKLCTEFVLNALKTRALHTLKLRLVIVEAIVKAEIGSLRRMINRHDGFKQLPYPLRGNALKEQAAQLGLLQRTTRVRVDTSTIREECELAQGRRDMKMSDEIGKNCIKVVMRETFSLVPRL